MKPLQSSSAEETVRFGRRFASSLRNGDVVALYGELGTGKTHFISGVCNGLGARGHVASPTFTLINEYPAERCTVVHIDLYRINSRPEVAALGVEEYFNEGNICLIEWAERMQEFLPDNTIMVRFAYGEKDDDRVIMVDTVREFPMTASDVPA